MSPPIFSSFARTDAGVRILDMTRPNWLWRLSGMLTPTFISPMTGRTYRGEITFVNLLNVACQQLGGTIAVVEPYVSTDWNEEYSHLYSRAFFEVPKMAQRIHFFRKSRPSLNYERLRNLPQAIRDAYVGYVVVRPLGGFRVGDSVLASPCTVGPNGLDLVHCLEVFNPYLLGNRLTIVGMPFMQQDTTVGVCAEADLWMMARYLNRRMEARRYRPAEITALARKTGALGPPSEGLTEYQMVDALQQMNLSPTCLYITKAEEAKEFIYTCVESGLPVIAGIPGHVVVVIGHDYEKSMNLSSPMHSMSATVRHFIAHDDASGPYQKMRTGTITAKTPGGRKVKLLTLDGRRVDFCLVVMPPRVHLIPEDVWDTAVLWTTMIRNHVAQEMRLDRNRLRQLPLGPKGLIFRIYLRLSSEFKNDLSRPTDRRCRNDVIAAKYLCTRMPKYVWVVEMARRSDLQGVSPHDRLIRGEIVLDSTGNKRLPEETLLAFHLDGAMYIPERAGRPAELFITQQAPYRPLQRRTL